MFPIYREIYHALSGRLQEISHSCCRCHKSFFLTFGTFVSQVPVMPCTLSPPPPLFIPTCNPCRCRCWLNSFLQLEQ